MKKLAFLVAVVMLAVSLTGCCWMKGSGDKDKKCTDAACTCTADKSGKCTCSGCCCKVPPKNAESETATCPTDKK